MKTAYPYVQYITALSILAAAMIAAGQAPAAAESLFETYANRPAEELRPETTEMGKELRETFNEADIARKQRQIDFTDYYANFKKLLLYGGKLANYANYEENLIFARDKAIFRSLPEDRDPAANRETYVNEKYRKMKNNVKEEIDTYKDLIHISLDACEIMSHNDLSGFMSAANNQTVIRRYLEQSKTYADFAERYSRLKSDWPDLAGRISAQIKLWQTETPKADAPIIDPELTEAIL